jgi:hypothetical protein
MTKRSKIWTIPKNDLQTIIDSSDTFVQVLEKLGYDGYNGNHRTLKKRINEENLDISKL